jgi:excinuclease ABC subunit A
MMPAMGKLDKNLNAIQIRGARTHNLKNIDVDILLNQITCIAGPSGSGKSSLAFHTLLTESKRRFINSLPTDMKFFWEIPHTVDVDKIYPVLPAWGLAQHNPVNNSRPVALDVLGGHERLQKIFMELGTYLCPTHHVPFEKISTVSDVISKIEALSNLSDDEVVHVFVPRSDYRKFIADEMVPSRSMDKSVGSFNELDPWYELVRVKIKNLNSLIAKINEFKIPEGVVLRFHLTVLNKNIEVVKHYEMKCPHCDQKILEARVSQIESLSPMNALGACPK